MLKPRFPRHEVTQPLDKPYRFIPLTQGQVAIVDISDFEFLSQFNWYAQWTERAKTFYVYRAPKTAMHRAILNSKYGEEVDHENHNGLDNRRSNLRCCTKVENARNRRIHKNNTSGFKGVVYSGRHSPWIAQIYVNRKKIHLGSFSTKELAKKSYDDAAKFYHGEFALLNSGSYEKTDQAANG